MSYEQLMKTTEQFKATPTVTMSGFGPYVITPPAVINTSKQAVVALLEEALKEGRASRDKKTGEWRIQTPGTDPQPGFMEGVKEIENTLKVRDQFEEITRFYNLTMVECYTDKIQAQRNSKIWLDFLSSKNVRAWNQITEELCKEFKQYRLSTPMARNCQEKPKPPCVLTVKRHLQFLNKSFDIAINKGYMNSNPVKFWKPDTHDAPLKQGLSPKELKAVLNEPVWQKDYLLNGKNRISLGYKLIDFLAVLFLSCKRRKEIINLNIDNINFKENFAFYKETKNSSKGTRYVIRKAFWLSPLLKQILRRVIGTRTEGVVFACPDNLKRAGTASVPGRLNGDYLSELFRYCVEKHAPGKPITLHCLRHTATNIMELAGLDDEAIDYGLGHYNVRTALPNYKDRTDEAVYRRLSARTRTGIEILSKSVKDILK
jgi:integrase